MPNSTKKRGSPGGLARASLRGFASACAAFVLLSAAAAPRARAEAAEKGGAPPPRAAAPEVSALRISQIDNSSLLTNQNVRVYVSATDGDGKPVTGLAKEQFSLSERAGKKERERAILSFEQGTNITRGINLLLVLDNSGSMYWDGTGRVKNSPDREVWRITYAKNAVLSLLNEIKNPLDRVGLVTFNVKIRERIRPTTDKGAIVDALERTTKPPESEAHTELYETLYQSIGYMRSSKGRRVIVVLSDGQNFPMKQNPDFPRRWGMEKAIEEAQREGISVFTIGLSARADRTNLSRIARETGGAYFSAFDPEELEGLYALIRDQILNEYLITYSASMEPAEKKLVTVRFEDETEAERFYFAATLFGIPLGRVNYAMFLLVPAALALLFALSRIRFVNKGKVPTLSVMPAVKTVAGTAAHGGTMVLTGSLSRARTLAIESQKTRITIGGSEEDDLTISGDPKIRRSEAAIERKGGVFTLKAEKSPVTVNNRPVKTKVLKSGDVIRVGDTAVVFDEGAEKKDS
jgi:Ca-activated chloride channel family protein